VRREGKLQKRENYENPLNNIRTCFEAKQWQPLAEEE
jgi:hypothetical protein